MKIAGKKQYHEAILIPLINIILILIYTAAL